VVGLVAFASSAQAAEWLALTGGGVVKTAAELSASIASEVEEKKAVY
jgi:hypothetical protein